ncbi:outer membrane beta-barrel protein [Pseudoalteromonas sp. CST5]|uniref:outer membrane beta-barrel protein n=1 Tax=unclassified Pseudoalteromonas TaxID=194690 RepID=UPI0023587A8B|nr:MULTISPECIES: outer membrane beta-barrel protein [unclassified Pseudoalteromonas]MDC9513877.1 outer membrane beta-barrel protein [Pseudoalteromonas sp. CST1]MDC9538320.1 outer membrane beta-barrel protein [Pseudoalteromonas sp. CST3]MDC9539853.1 outer membrane beta-barrel protein [Pseudoalteromonas sp. CST2]MDC9544995.1 outer membrane beta-barrel protein [Pseudoalteromonas sp. CST4]MDC9547996.1 outer membrane beta-barrel protein [Pseudoalteromonas sp. CST5]
MKKNKIAILLVTAVITSPAAFAESPNFNYVAAGYLDGDIDGDDADGWTFDGSTLLGENFFLSGQYQTLGNSDDGVDVDLNWLSAGIGYRTAIGANTDFYGLATYENVELEASYRGSNASNDENGYSLSVGVRSMVSDNIELDGRVGNVDIADESETSFSVGARYYINNNVSLGANYTSLDELDLVSLTARYSF